MVVIGVNAFFGPGVYGNGDIYGEMLRPAARGKLFFAGEAMSACNGCVASFIRKGGIVLFVDYLTLFRLFRDYLI